MLQVCFEFMNLIIYLMAFHKISTISSICLNMHVLHCRVGEEDIDVNSLSQDKEAGGGN